jgi:hypothetical protein
MIRGTGRGETKQGQEGRKRTDVDSKYDYRNHQESSTLVRTQGPSPPDDHDIGNDILNQNSGRRVSPREMSADDVRVQGPYCTDIDKKNVIEHRHPRSRRPMYSRQLTGKANVRVVAAVACLELIIHQVDDYEGEDEGKDPMQCRQSEHGSDHGEEPFP